MKSFYKSFINNSESYNLITIGTVNGCVKNKKCSERNEWQNIILNKPFLSLVRLI